MSAPADSFVLRQGRPDDWPAVRALLVDAGLPVADLAADAMRQFIVASTGRANAETLAGVIALQALNGTGLLRSLAVAQAVRSAGCGSRLVEAVERAAMESGLRDLWLLTTGAALYFEKLGYRAVSRAIAPAGIRETAEFASLCPDSAVLMTRSLPS